MKFSILNLTGEMIPNWHDLDILEPLEEYQHQILYNLLISSRLSTLDTGTIIDLADGMATIAKVHTRNPVHSLPIAAIVTGQPWFLGRLCQTLTYSGIVPMHLVTIAAGKDSMRKLIVDGLATRALKILAHSDLADAHDIKESPLDFIARKAPNAAHIIEAIKKGGRV